jgi:hypothetical protein
MPESEKKSSAERKQTMIQGDDVFRKPSAEALRKHENAKANGSGLHHPERHNP